MKKLVALLMTGCLLFSVTGCGNTSSDHAGTAGDTKSQIMNTADVSDATDASGVESDETAVTQSQMTQTEKKEDAAGGDGEKPASAVLEEDGNERSSDSNAADLVNDSESQTKIDIALVTGAGELEDGSYNQISWESIQSFCREYSLQCRYYHPQEHTDGTCMEQIDQAVADGAKAVVMPGSFFVNTIGKAQSKYPDVAFLSLDVSQKAMNAAHVTVGENTALITFKEEEAGYLAGYAAVAEGYRKLGFLGGVPVAGVIRYGYGFLQGANAAAEALGVDKVDVKYWYSYTFSQSDAIRDKMNTWYADGTEVVFACGGGIGESCNEAAKANNAVMIGVDVDQSGMYDTVIVSAMKNIQQTIDLCLRDLYENDWHFSDTYAGKETQLGAAQNSICLSMTNSRLENFTVGQYDQLYANLVAGKISISNKSDADSIPIQDHVTLDYEF